MSFDRTVRGVFDKAMYLIDAQNDSTGSTMNSDTKDYQVRTLGILNSLIDDVYPSSYDYIVGESGERPALDDLESFDDEIDMDEYVVRGILPYGLASKLIGEENPSLANTYLQIYQERLVKAKQSVPSSFESIGDGEFDVPYGGIEYGEFSRWNC